MLQGRTWRLFLGAATIALAGLAPAGEVHAGSTCPEGMWSSHGSCCDLGHEYVASKNECLPKRPERRCVEGHLDDCVVAGRQLEQRGSIGAGYAAELYRYACDEGHAPACRGLGGLHDKGLGVERDEVRGRALYVQACDGGDAPACTLLAEQMIGDESTSTRALALFAQACHRGDALACNEYGEQLSHRPEHNKQSALYFERACVGGVGSACRSVLVREHDRSPERARELLDRGCHAGDAESCVQLGDLFHGALLGPRNSSQAALRYGAACDLSNVSGCMKLAELTADGDGVARDLTRASELYTRACGAGVEFGCDRASSLQAQQLRERSVSRVQPLGR
ncbi:MAG: Glycerol-3-phosphate transporter, ATP-binding protein UgpC [Myxococcaceae bacterium]|nr:Glycerol-3-phosphate transporter, ATP-binding protein UgpC [Myxococcaceae bacterium]